MLANPANQFFNRICLTLSTWEEAGPILFSLDKMKQLLFCSIACVLLKARLCLTAGVVRSLRYVMEVIQRGRTAVRPALFPPLSVVPAVSDSELSEPEYVHYVLPVLLPVTLPIMSQLPIVHGKPTSLPILCRATNVRVLSNR